jgi:hypothetical protein
MTPVGAAVGRRPRHLVGLYSKTKRQRVLAADEGTLARFLNFPFAVARHKRQKPVPRYGIFLRDQAAAAAACLFGDRLARRSTLWARLCSPPGLAMTSINSFWAST